MSSRRPVALLLLLVPALIAAGDPPPTRFAAPLRMAEHSLRAMQSAKPGQEISFPAPFRGAVANLPPAGMSLAAGMPEPVLAVLVVTEDEGASLLRAGFEISTQAGVVSVVSAPLSRLAELETLEHVVRVDLARPVKPLLDVSRGEVNADDAHGSGAPPYPPGGYTGQGVCMGVIDSGIDVTHQDFKNADGTTRIAHLWDQTDDGASPGPPPEFPCTANRTHCGTEWTEAQINAGASRQRDVVGHGSHVTGIAAGNGRATGNGKPAFQFIGMAPEAEILAVNTTFSDAAILDGVNWIFRRAGSKPAVVNLSLGSHFGPHDGTDSFDLGLRAFSGPGQIIVAAAGNEGDVPIHAEVSLPGGQTRTVTLSVPAYTPQSGSSNDIAWIEAWYPGGRALTFTAKSPGNAQVVGPVSSGQQDVKDTVDGTIWVENNVEPTNNGDRLASIILYDNTVTRAPKVGTWTIEIKNNSAQATEVDLWIALNSLIDNQGFQADVKWTSNLDVSELVSSPATSDSVIAVGAYCTKKVWIASTNQQVQYPATNIQVGLLAPFSSPGPRRDGALKPEISAPGIGIGAAISVHANPNGDPLSLLPDLQHIINQGTSQASPHVAGVAALILQANPTWARNEVLNALLGTARADGNTGAVPNMVYGHGKLDVKAAVDFATPVRLLALTAAWTEGRAIVRWSLAESEPGTAFTVERAPSEGGPYRAVSDVLFGDLEFAWEDPDPRADEAWYRVRALERTGDLQFLGPVRMETGALGIVLFPAAPNPFTASTVIAFTLDRPGNATVEIVDVRGRLIRVLAAEELAAGRHELTWSGLADDGRRAAAGVYFARLTTASARFVSRVVLSD